MTSIDKTKVLSRNNITVQGNGEQAILFVHGYGCDQNMWRFVIPDFLEDYKVILMDHVGAGNSDESYYSKQKYGNLQGYADDILEVCKVLDLKELIIVGHSVSAMIALLAANKEPELFTNIIMIGPSPCYVNKNGYRGGFNQEDIDDLLNTLDKNYLGWAATMAPAIMGNPERPELGEELKNSFCQSNPEIAKHFAQVTFLSDNREDLPKLHIPTLIIQSKEDVIAPLEVAQYVYNQIPTSTLEIIDATGHCPNLSAPKQTVRAIKQYLQGQE